ncbi:hypothetical protein Droror1_Dr00007347 [Drosera rotundifolia]
MRVSPVKRHTTSIIKMHSVSVLLWKPTSSSVPSSKTSSAPPLLCSVCQHKTTILAVKQLKFVGPQGDASTHTQILISFTYFTIFDRCMNPSSVLGLPTSIHGFDCFQDRAFSHFFGVIYGNG